MHSAFCYISFSPDSIPTAPAGRNTPVELVRAIVDVEPPRASDVVSSQYDFSRLQAMQPAWRIP